MKSRLIRLVTHVTVLAAAAVPVAKLLMTRGWWDG